MYVLMYLLYCNIHIVHVTFRINSKGFYLEFEFSKPRIHLQKKKNNLFFGYQIGSGGKRGRGERRKK